MSDNIYFIDFEASSLSWESYPIEIAWGSDIKNIQSFLISPESIDGWVDWSNDSQKIHRLERQYVLENGLCPRYVCDRIQENLEGRVVYSDNPDWDSMWMLKLFLASEKVPPEIDVRHIDELLIDIVCPNLKVRVEGLFEILKAKSNARNMVKERHRAAFDVQYLIELFKLAKGITIGSKGRS